MNPLVMTVVMLAAWGIFVLQMTIKFVALKKMAPENRWNNIGKRIKRLFKMGFAQEKLIGPKRERASGIMHAFIFWGALMVGIRELTLMGEGFVTGFQEYLPFLGSEYLMGYLYISIYNVSEVIVLTMVMIALYRRIFKKPSRLELNWEGIYVLLFIAFIMITDLLFDAARLNLIEKYNHSLHFFKSEVFGVEWDWAPFTVLIAKFVYPFGENGNAFLLQFSYWGHVAGMLIFINLLINTKQFHEITALPNIFLGSIDYPHSIAPLVNLEDESVWEEERIGINKLQHLTWKQGLDLYSCTECGRCHDVCPTFVTEKPLTLKRFNKSLLSHLRQEEKNLFFKGQTAEDKKLVGDIIRPETLWACTTCRACEEVCPVVAVLITDPGDIGTDSGTSEVVEESEESPATPADIPQEAVMATGDTTSLFFHKPNKWLNRAKDVLSKEQLPTTGIEKAKDMFKDLRKQTLDSLPRGKDYIALVDNEKCIGCTQCVYFCNFASIDMISWDLQARTSQFESKKALILEDTCTGCTLCAFACPVEAITMESRV